MTCRAVSSKTAPRQAADHAIRPQFHEAFHHDPAEAGAPAGHQEALSLE